MSPTASWRCGRFELPLTRPLVMGVINLTPDSFSDGGSWTDPDAAWRHAEALIADGADILDIGAESTRPGAPPVPVEVELERLQGFLERLQRFSLPVPVSIDTSQPQVMRAALDSGVSIVNDVRALGVAGAFDLAIGAIGASGTPGAIGASGTNGANGKTGTIGGPAREFGIVLMHMQGTPASMQLAPAYDDVVAEVGDFLGARARQLEAAGVAAQRIVIDPGFGFGKTVDHNLALLAHLPQLAAIGYPLLVGLSRKSLLGRLAGGAPRPPAQRVAASVAAALLAVERGAAIVRVHDVAATRDALRVLQAVSSVPERPPA